MQTNSSFLPLVTVSQPVWVVFCCHYACGVHVYFITSSHILPSSFGPRQALLAVNFVSTESRILVYICKTNKNFKKF